MDLSNTRANEQRRNQARFGAVRWKLGVYRRDDGTSEAVTIVSVDDEGFVYELIPPDQTQYYWNRFEDVESVK